MKKISAVIGFFVIVIMVFYFIKTRMVVPEQQVSEMSKDSGDITDAKKFDALQRRTETHKPFGFDPQSSDSMDKYWNDRYETNVTTVTNIVKSGTNSTRVQITSVRKNKHFGTDDWELFSKIQFQNDCALEPGQSQILDILREYPPAGIHHGYSQEPMLQNLFFLTFVTKWTGQLTRRLDLKAG